MQIKGAVAFVTGANRGLGRALVEALIARGAHKVYAGVRNPAEFTLPGATAVKIDVTDADSVANAVQQCGDVTLLINNAGIALVRDSALDPDVIGDARTLFETNYFGVVRATQAFVPALKANGGGAIINVLSDATWFAVPLLAAYSASKSAAWGFTNALRLELRTQGIQVLGLHVGFMDTDMTKGLEMEKVSPQSVAAMTLDGLETGQEEVLADEGTRAIKQSLSSDKPAYLNPHG